MRVPSEHLFLSFSFMYSRFSFPHPFFFLSLYYSLFDSVFHFDLLCQAFNGDPLCKNRTEVKNMSSSNSPCAACKLRRRKCTQDCVFAPYFPPDQPQKFANVHEVFGASNVAKLLNELNPSQREDAVNSLAYEAAARLRDPVYGCVGLISILQHKLRLVQQDLSTAKKELSNYIGTSAMLPVLPHPGVMSQHPHNPSSSAVLPYNIPQMLALQMGQSHGGGLVIRDPQQQHPHPHQMLEAQQLAAVTTAREQQEMLRSYELQHQHQEVVRFNNGFDLAGHVGFNQMAGTAMSPSLGLGSFDNHYQVEQQPPEHPHHPLQLQAQLQEHPHHQLQLLPQEHPHHHHLQLQPQELLLEHEQQQPQQLHAQQRSGSEEGTNAGPSR